MKKANKFLALIAVAGLAACAQSGPPEDMFPLVDNTGATVAMVRASVVRNTPPGTAVRANINGMDQLVTLGPRVSAGVSAGQAVITGTDGSGRPIVEHVGPASGSFAPEGTPVITSTRDGRPVVTYVQPGQAAPTGTVAGPRGNRRAGFVAPGTLAPGTAPTVDLTPGNSTQPGGR
ncbi:MAG: hypothetical protein WCP77_10025 [Roseococcus sp.]